MSTTPSIPGRPLGPGTFALLAAGFVAFVVYGSLVPVHYEPLPLAEAVARFRVVCARPVRVTLVADWVTNVLLFVPLGFLLMAALGVDRPRPHGLGDAVLVLPFCAALSVAVEFAQLYFPPRVSSLDDIAAESLGGVLGVLAWLAAGQRLTDWLRCAWQSLAGDGRGARLLSVYLLSLVLTHAWPLDLTLRPSELYYKYKIGRVHVWPWDFRDLTMAQVLTKQVTNALYFLPVGVLLGALRPRVWHGPGAWRRVLLAGLAVAAAVEFVQLLVESRNCESLDVINGALAVLGGWAACSRIQGASFPLSRGSQNRVGRTPCGTPAARFCEPRLNDGLVAGSAESA